MIQEIANVLRRFVTICGITLLILVILGPLAHAINGISNIQLATLALCCAAAALSSLLFLSAEELHGMSWWVREILCIAINMAITVPLTHKVGLWQSTIGMMIVMVIILIIAFGNHLIEFLLDMRTAGEINKRIQEMR